MRLPSHPSLTLSVLTLSAICAAALSACGGGSSDTAAAPTSAPAATTLTGAVAVGAPITGGKLKILDATGAVVVSDVAIDSNGQYPAVTLTGPAPYRIEACGYAGPNYVCVYSVAAAGGTANVSSLTTATVLLATGQAPGTLMTGTAPTLTTDSVATAQTQLRTSLANVLASAGVSSTLDFVSADLSAGSRSGYDGVLDAVGVSIGQDANAFVQITPRLGQGNLYMEQGHTTGAVTNTVSAESLQMSRPRDLVPANDPVAREPDRMQQQLDRHRAFAGVERTDVARRRRSGERHRAGVARPLRLLRDR